MRENGNKYKKTRSGRIEKTGDLSVIFDPHPCKLLKKNYDNGDVDNKQNLLMLKQLRIIYRVS